MQSRTQLLVSALTKTVAGFFLIGLLLFLPAGTWNYPGAWRFIGLLFVPMLILGVVLLCKAPELLEKRLKVKEEQSEQKQVILFSGLILVSGFVLAGLDFRFGWTQLPTWGVVLASVLFLFSYALYAQVLRENEYLSRIVEIQEDQKVIDTGLYGIVRHPMYSAVTIMFLSIPLVLGSVAAVLPFLLIPAVLIKRIRNEEDVLEKGLDGYVAYKNKVKYRMIPYIW